jgi:dTDP-4-dehydrorhamnose reductase
VGILHLGGPERISRHALGLGVAHAFGLSAEGISATTHAERPPLAPRPRDACLDSARTRATLGWEPRPLEAAIRASRPAPIDE